MNVTVLVLIGVEIWVGRKAGDSYCGMKYGEEGRNLEYRWGVVVIMVCLYCCDERPGGLVVSKDCLA